MRVEQIHLKQGVRCRVCNTVKPLDQFHRWERAGVPQVSIGCTACQSRAPYQDGKRGQHTRSPAYQKNCQTIARAKAVPCADCKQTFPACCIDFDHRPDQPKTHNIATLKSRDPRILAAEIAKCDVVCSNCHRIRSEKRGWSKGRPRSAAK